MIRPHCIEHRVRRRAGAKPDSARLAASIDKMQCACRRANMSVDEFLSLPVAQVIEFAREHRIAVEDLRDICDLLIERLDALDLQCAEMELLLRS